jgi:hypothetical protein
METPEVTELLEGQPTKNLASSQLRGSEFHLRFVAPWALQNPFATWSIEKYMIVFRFPNCRKPNCPRTMQTKVYPAGLSRPV